MIGKHESEHSSKLYNEEAEREKQKLKDEELARRLSEVNRNVIADEEYAKQIQEEYNENLAKEYEEKYLCL